MGRLIDVVRRRARALSFFATPLLAAPVVAALLACDGGANQNQKQVGDEPGGVNVALGDVAVAPVGSYVVFQSASTLLVGWPASGATAELPVEQPTKLAFAPDREVVYVGSTARGRHAIIAVDVASRRALWSAETDSAAPEQLRLEVTDDDRYVVASSLRFVSVYDAESGELVRSLELDRSVRDLELTPDAQRAIIVQAHDWNEDVPETVVVVLELATGATRTFSVPNCSADLVLTPDGSRGFLAPTLCQKDPVSTLELEAGVESFSHNLPGFGPVALAPDGTVAVAFLDADNVAEELFDDPEQIPPPSSTGADRYHLMVIDTKSLTFELTAYGNTLPRYAITPNGAVVLVDSSFAIGESVELFDTTTRSFHDVKGPRFPLNNFTISSDSRHAYAAAAGLYDLDIENAVARELPVSFAPSNLNISADDSQLFLRRSPTELCVYDLEAQRCSRTLRYTVSVSR